MWKTNGLHHACLVQQKMSYHTLGNLPDMITASDKQFTYFKHQQPERKLDKTITYPMTPKTEENPTNKMGETKEANHRDTKNREMTNGGTNTRKRNRRRRRNRKKKRSPACDATQPPAETANRTKESCCQILASLVKSPSFTSYRNRQISTTESEDSFIFFEETDSPDIIPTSESDSEEEICSSSASGSIVPNKKVRFAQQSELCVVHRMIKWAWAYQAARKGQWEECARDRERFRNRIWNSERVLRPILGVEHREKIYKLRFLPETEGN